MKKQTTTAGPTGFGWVRSLVTFRHHNRFARLVSTLAAFAIAMLLVGTSAAYADDAPAEPAASETAAPAEDGADASADPSAEPSSDPSSDSSSTTSSTSSDASAPKSSPMMTTLKKLATSDVTIDAVPVDVTVPCKPGTAVMVPVFQIDGDLCPEGGLDWDNASPVAYESDGFSDNTAFTNGTQEDNDPSTWVVTETNPKPNGKSDIGTAYAYSTVDTDVYAYFGFTNDSDSGGTQWYDLEYNQLANYTNDQGASVPNRSSGDLLFRFFSGGSDPLTFVDDVTDDKHGVLEYHLTTDPEWGADCLAVSSSSPAGGWCPLDFGPDTFVTALSDDGKFGEGSIDITTLYGPGDCSAAFSYTQFRSVTGGSFGSSLKDRVAPLNSQTPSTCGSLLITKSDADTDAPVGGAVFSITDDPRPGETGTLCVYDGPDGTKPPKPAGCDSYYADGTADGTVTISEVEPGDYTVTEIVPPPGYMLNGDSTDSWSGHVDEHETQQVPFSNRKIWLPLNVTKTATGHYGAQYFWDIEKWIAPTADGPWSSGTALGTPLVKNVASGDDTSLYYKVVVTEDHVTTSHYVVDGTIHVDNPNSAPVTAEINESLSGCTIDGAADPATVSVPAGGHTYSYSCDLGNGPQSAGTNTAVVTWDMGDYPQATDQLVPDTDPAHYTDSGSDGYTFDDESPVNKTITVEDPYFGGGALMMVTYGDDPSGSYDSDVYSHDPDPTAGTCSAVIQNTATLYNDADAALGDDSEYGKVCVGADLTATVDDTESLTRTFPWSVEKATTTPTVTVANGAATATYNVTVTAGAPVDSNWHIGGNVTVTNPNDWESVSLTDLTVSYSGSNDADQSDDCSVTGDPTTPAIAAGGNRVLAYSCSFASQPDYTGTIDATATWDDSAAHTPTDSAPASSAVAGADWAVTEVDPTVTVHDDRASGQDVVIGTLDAATVYAMVGHKTVINYTVNLSGLPAAGACANKVNTVWVVGHDGIHLDADQNSANNQATVQVCTPAVATVVVSPPEQQHPNVLPNTGGPDRWLLAAGLALVLAGGALVVGDRRRRRRS